MTLFVAAILLLGSIALTRSVFRGRVANPLLAFFPIYVVLLVCYQVTIWRSTFSLSLDSAGSWFLSGSLLAFFLGVVSVVRFTANKEEVAPEPDVRAAEIALAEKLSVLVLLVFFASVVYKYKVLGGKYDSVLGDIENIRGDYVLGDLSYGPANFLAIFSQNYLGITLGILLGYRPTRKIKWLALAMMPCVFLNDMSIGGAWWTFQALVVLSISVVCSYEVLADRRLGWRQVRAVLAGFVLLFGTIFALFQIRTQGMMLDKATPFEVVLFYTGGQISSFQYFYDNPIASEPRGRHTLGGMYGFVDLAARSMGSTFLEEPEKEDYLADIGEAYNTSIYLSYVYADFGVVGALLVTFILGAFSAYFYVHAVRRKRILDVQLASLLLFTAFISIRSVATQGQYYWVLLVVFWLQHVWARRVARRARKREELNRGEADGGYLGPATAPDSEPSAGS